MQCLNEKNALQNNSVFCSFLKKWKGRALLDLVRGAIPEYQHQRKAVPSTPGLFISWKCGTKAAFFPSMI